MSLNGQTKRKATANRSNDLFINTSNRRVCQICLFDVGKGRKKKEKRKMFDYIDVGNLQRKFGIFIIYFTTLFNKFSI